MSEFKLISAVREIRQECSPRRRILAGISGGCDSMVLLHLLHQSGFKKVTVCHLNHQLRGRSSDADARLVEKIARKLGFEFLGESADVKSFAAASKQSLETAARNARHAFFERCAKTTRCHELWLAHHADDQAETVLMNLLRGSGLRGLGGMRSISEMNLKEKGHPAPQKTTTSLTIVRPFLAISREEIRAFAREHKIAFREDASNLSHEHLRNRIRLQLLPAASEIMGRDVRQPLLRLAETVREEDALLEEMAARLFDQSAESIPIKSILAAPIPIQRRALHAWLKQQSVPSLTFELLENIRSILPPTTKTAKLNLPGGRHIKRKAGFLHFTD